MSDNISRAEVHKILSLLATEGGTDAKMLLSDAHEFIDSLPSADAVQTDLVQRSDVLEVISEAQDGSGSTYNILQPIFVKVNNLPSCHRCYECDEQFYQQILEKGMIELPQEYVSVVRCKDCRHRDLFSCPLADNDFQKDEDFCSWGERREKNE
ncbi:MAG: hypothetical protein IKG01_02355 [Lachnospiraceae bacterium]|nr:hypothetical protein [Lachnospiraceae bacterium]